MPSTSKKPRLLCIHGHGSNSTVTTAQIVNLGFNKTFEVTYLTAPLSYDGEVDHGVESMCPNGPFRSWMNQKNSLSDLVASMKYVLQHVLAQGPYDAIYGFSQGAGIAALLSCKEIRSKLTRDMADDLNREVTNAETPWRFFFAACATFPVSLKDIATYLDIGKSFPIEIPSAHLIGIEDSFKGRSEEFFDSVSGGEDVLSLAVYFEGGHEISSDIYNLKKAAYAAIDWFSKFNPNAINTCSFRGPDRSILRGITEEIESMKRLKTGNSMVEGLSGQYQLKNNSTINDDDVSLGALLKREKIADHIAFRAPGKKPITYGALRSFVEYEGNLSTIDCKSGDKIAYLAPFGVLGAVAFISIAAQCQAIPLDPESSSKDLEDAFFQLRPDLFIIFDDLGVDVCDQAKLSAIKSGIRIVHATGKTDKAPFSFVDYELPDPKEKTFLENKGNDTCLLLRTSGTTSGPKIVPLKMSSVVSNAISIAKNLGLRKDDVGLNAMPLFHIGGLMTNLLASFVSGGSSIFLPKFDVSVFIGALINGEDFQPTWFSAVPTMLSVVETFISSEEAYRSSLRFIRVGAAAISEDLIRQAQLKFGCRVVPTYSMTECMPISQPPSGSILVDEKPSSVGKALNVSICIVDSSQVPLPRNNTNDMQTRIGEICISGPNVMTGYISNASANQKVFFRLGGMIWFRTGDLGYLDEDGFLYVTGRSKDMIKINGDQVSPIEVENACMKFSKFKTCVAFSQPSRDNWGEQVGIACVLTDSLDFSINEIKIKTGLRSFLKTEGLLANSKIPKRIEIVEDVDLPKTKTGKYIRAGLSSVLDEISPSIEPDNRNVARKTPFHRAAVGAQFILAVAVMYVHIGNLNYWTIPLSGEPNTYTRTEGIASLASGWSNTRGWCFHTPLFFFVGGFLLANGIQSPISDKASLMNFYKIRILSLHPMYLVSILLCTLLFVLRCNPDNFIQDFDPNREPLEGENFVCQATPMELSWGWTLFTSVMNYSFLLQAWPMTLPFSWFLSYYTWFSSVYIFCIFVFPWCHKPFFAARNDRRALWKLVIIWASVLYAYMGVVSMAFTVQEDESIFNWFALSIYLFPPGWLPCFSIGIGSCFLLKEYFKSTSFEASSARKWGFLTDTLSFVFLVGWVLNGIFESLAKPDIAVETEIGARYWALLVSRLVCPIGFLWYVGISIGRGGTGWLLSGDLIVNWLAPASYNIFLFHQPISEIYFLATRQLWWAFPKSYYWFSPYAIPVQNWEIPIVMIIVTIFSVFMHFSVNEKLIAASTCCLLCFQNPKDSLHEGKPVADIVKEIVARASNIEPSQIRDETGLNEIGLSSMALPVAVSEINVVLNSVGKSRLSLASVTPDLSVNALVELVNKELKPQRRSFTTNCSIDLESGNLDIVG